MKKAAGKKGQSILEVLFSVAVVSITMVTLMIIVVRGLKDTRFAKNSALANQYMQEALETVRQERDNNSWEDFVSSHSGGCQELDEDKNWHTGCVWDSLGSGVGCEGSYPLDIFYRCLNFTLDEAEKIKVEARVVWSEGGKNYQTGTTTILTKWTR